MNLVQFIALTRLQIPGASLVTHYVRDGLVDVVFDPVEISSRLICAFAALSNTIAAMVPYRNAPTTAPWCPIVIDPRDDTDTERIAPYVTPAGLIVPVPSHLITAEMAKHMSVSSTDITRWFEPPDWLCNGEAPPSVMLGR